ncbi:hypothetical protein GL325_11585 [Aeromicrobium sp. 636]|uniref:Uncharacterized protein n=1 Tax=Aeromicrobium senzhongii TaxID=2663859 RepID=A0A8I0K122_9ACTN|nr:MULTISPECIES: hypothetical protein [Aeromicrobium]MBC9226971.1 hypothetical protein [Aeromicrobium senzhongii]MCQ3999071.1 hypothetical protein [Aeromicrobium sp. 636]
MNRSIQDPLPFIPAETTAEAIARIYALTGAPVQSRGEKRALVALRDALHLDVDVVRTNAVLGERLAGALDLMWDRGEFTERNKVNLAGLNALLDGAYRAYDRGSLSRLRDMIPETLDGPGWESFQPAVSKIEAVTRIAALTGAPSEWLGPGSKEHKSVLVNLADRVLPDAALDRTSKTRLGRDLAHAFGARWTDDCYSTGETISLKGLNTILAGAERRLGRLGSNTGDVLISPESEGAALAAALNDGWRSEPWDGVKCIEWMRDSNVRGYNENEWQGWYFEARGREILNAAFTPAAVPPRSRYGNTTFDYRLNHVWDLKAHTSEQRHPMDGSLKRRRDQVILNDAAAIRECVADQGLGFLVLSGQGVMDDDGSFVSWHRAFKAVQGGKVAPSNSGKSRPRKSAFIPLAIEAFWIADLPALNAAISAGHLAVKPQGRQAPKESGGSGAARADKFHMDLGRARSDLRVAERTWRRTSFRSAAYSKAP